jgi:hypothetical protein
MVTKKPRKVTVDWYDNGKVVFTPEDSEDGHFMAGVITSTIGVYGFTLEGKRKLKGGEKMIYRYVLDRVKTGWTK